MPVERGIVLYDIELNGCLNGVYANEQNPTAGVIFNEIARKIKNTRGIIGEYDCFYFETGNRRQRNTRCNAILIISPTTHANVFKFEWLELPSRTRVFMGVGYQMNDRQIAVHYTSAP